MFLMSGSARWTLFGEILVGDAAGWLAGGAGLALVTLGAGLFAAWLALRYIPHNSVGIVEKLWSRQGSVPDGSIIALHGEAGYQADVLRGGVHWGYWRWQYRIHRAPLVTVPQGKIGYVYARDGEPLPASQTLGRTVESRDFQDARAFLAPEANGGKESLRGQRGRQRAILREGVYAINTSLFVVITENTAYALPRLQSPQEMSAIRQWHEELDKVDGFGPVVIGKAMAVRDPLHPETEILNDSIGIVTVHDGPSLDPGEIIAPTVGWDRESPCCHDNFQSPEAFLTAGGRRGRQYQVLTDGTYFVNRWFATIEAIPKTVVPIGYVGVVVSYFGRTGLDRSGIEFRHGERVAEGERGVWDRPLGPGKYAFNTYAGNIVLVPTTNFVLHWITGKSESHRYDESLKSIDLVTRDAYEPSLPLSVVVHIDYMRAPNVIQRFGDVRKLITQTLDPLLSAYFRDIAHRKTMLELLHDRDTIQGESREELRRRFREFDIECVDVLIGKPTTDQEGGKIESLLEQLRLRQLSIEQLETYERQRAASEQLQRLNEAQAQAQMQTQLTNARVQAQIAESQGEADLAKARKRAEQEVMMADADLKKAQRQAEQRVVLAEAECRSEIMTGRGQGQHRLQVGLADAAVLARKAAAYGDPRLFVLSQASATLANSTQPLVPERVFVSQQGSGDGGAGQPAQGLWGALIELLVANQAGIPLQESADSPQMRQSIEKLAHEAMESLRQSPPGA